jgi:hypothetical protein
MPTGAKCARGQDTKAQSTPTETPTTAAEVWMDRASQNFDLTKTQDPIAKTME